jgi:hypothetical protein
MRLSTRRQFSTVSNAGSILTSPPRRFAAGLAVRPGGSLQAAHQELHHCWNYLGCVSSSVERIGTVSYTPRPPNSEVAVFTDASQIKEPYDVVGIISYDNPGKYQILTLGDAIEPLKTKAREIGANAIIIDKSQRVKSGIISTGIWAEARAIHLKGRP